MASVTCRPSTRLHLEVRVSHTALTEKNSYDMAAIRVRILDENGNPAPYAQLPVTFTPSGELELAGPSIVTAEGGMCGAYVRTRGQAGTASLTVHTGQAEDVAVHFTVALRENIDLCKHES